MGASTSASSRVGCISETAIELDLLNRGFNVLYPTIPTRYDRLVETAHGFVRVQIKTARVDARDGNLRVTYEFPYDPKQVDVIAVFDPHHNEIYYIPISDIPEGAKGFTIRITERKNKRKTNSLMASEYKNFPRLEVDVRESHQT